MKLLLDQNLSRRLIEHLKAGFPGSTQVALEGLELATDLEIWDFAKKNKFVIVTKDSDFEELSVIRGFPPKVIWIRVGNSQNKVVLDILLKNKQQIESILSQSEISCIELHE